MGRNLLTQKYQELSNKKGDDKSGKSRDENGDLFEAIGRNDIAPKIEFAQFGSRNFSRLEVGYPFVDVWCKP